MLSSTISASAAGAAPDLLLAMFECIAEAVGVCVGVLGGSIGHVDIAVGGIGVAAAGVIAAGVARAGVEVFGFVEALRG